MPKPPSVFISYAREDYATASRICQDLKSFGVDVWLDKESLLPGQDWDAEIHNVIRSADYFISLLSNVSLAKRGVYQKELREAKEVLDEIPEGQIFFLPVRVDDCQPKDSGIRKLDWVDLFPSYPAGLDRILRVIRPPGWNPSDIVRPTGLQVDTDLASQGWGVIFPEGSNPAIRDALRPLLELRREQATGRGEKLYREFEGEFAYRKGTSHVEFLRSNGTNTGASDPSKMPGYLLLVGSPEEIPFEVQYGLAMQRHVGRIHFDTVDEYRCYARNVIRAEAQAAASGGAVSFFCPTHPGDRGTDMAERLLAEPLFESARLAFPRHSFTKYSGEQATKKALIELLSEERLRRPDFLFLFGHGMAFRPGDDRQLSDQGAFVCSDWRGVGNRISEGDYLRAKDLPASADLTGLQVFLLAEYGGGTSATDPFGAPDRPGTEIAPQPFVSGLAKGLLGRPNGATAIIAHVDRCWTSSFAWEQGSSIQTFLNVAASMLSGKPAGAAQRYFSSLCGELAALVEQVRAEGHVNDASFQKARVAMLDARNYIVLGDPAARSAAR